MKNRTSAHTRMQIMVTCAMLVAIQIVLVRFLSIQTPFQRVSFGFLPIAMAGMLFGPGYGCAVAGISDLLGPPSSPPAGPSGPASPSSPPAPASSMDCCSMKSLGRTGARASGSSASWSPWRL